MKKIDLGQTISILANIGVIAGIVFLGYELNQNNRFLAEEARYAMLLNQTLAGVHQASWRTVRLDLWNR